jgi:F-type H+-transporting ATPase subunit delta
MSANKVARIYATALMEVCDASKEHAVVSRQLSTFAAALDASKELRDAFRSPVILTDEKRAILHKLFGKLLFAPTVRNFILVLLDHDRLTIAAAISLAFNAMLDVSANRVHAIVSSAVALEKTELDQIQKEAQRLTGKEVEVHTEVDPQLIGGVVTKIGNILLDGSVQTDLNVLKEALHN